MYPPNRYGTPPPRPKRIPIGNPYDTERQEALLHFPYRETLAQAHQNNGEATRKLKAYFTERERMARSRAKHREYCCKNKASPNVARLKLITSLLQHLRIGMERIEHYILACQKAGRTPEITFWERYDDHQVLAHPYMEEFSFYDKIALLEGVPGVVRGLAASPCPYYGTISVTEQGWHLSYGGKLYPMDAEGLHALVVRNTTVQALPFSTKGVLPTISWYAPFDGESIVVPSNAKVYLDGTLKDIVEFVQHDGETIQLEAQAIRLSMYQPHYAMLVHSVSYPRYQDVGSKACHDATLRCFGETRIPRTLIEGEYWLKATRDTACSREGTEQDFTQFKTEFLAQHMQQRGEHEHKGDEETEEQRDLDEQPF